MPYIPGVCTVHDLLRRHSWRSARGLDPGTRIPGAWQWSPPGTAVRGLGLCGRFYANNQNRAPGHAHARRCQLELGVSSPFVLCAACASLPAPGPSAGQAHIGPRTPCRSGRAILAEGPSGGCEPEAQLYCPKWAYFEPLLCMWLKMKNPN